MNDLTAEIFCEVGLILRKMPFLSNSVKFVTFNAFSFIFTGFEICFITTNIKSLSAILPTLYLLLI